MSKEVNNKISQNVVKRLKWANVRESGLWGAGGTGGQRVTLDKVLQQSQDPS